MPCYLFTFHTYGSWLPDRPRGFVRRHAGLLAQNKDLADVYRGQMVHGTVSLADEVQLAIIATLLKASPHVDCRPHSIATDNNHIHLLVSWKNEERGWEQTRSSFKKSMTLELKGLDSSHKWLSRDASRKQIQDRDHFDYLVNSYLPDHRGWKWDERVGYFKTMDELRQGLSDDA
ncbi:hypothetical protein [Aeoliella sp. SH292]|uniref:hypothetical protein n=1 Tax=Aeoliella sp. SH292 TaxID=3454464 RepID=UPI003F956FC3